ncbi:diaminobutyrate--2-oxoglutarate transaminase [Ferrimonas gelatinilytica]|uniref:Diaminobutyrate--2-oxoglutarate transaminase n=1 Tax=Ferrimonas gelatinilytica TaxID=1255257 RepID=A0ABP9RZS8_9GAMM
MTPFDQLESDVQSYARSFPVMFGRAQGACLFDQEGKRYLDFLAGAGTLNYGHNNPVLKEALLEYINNDGVAHGLDMHTEAKAQFLDTFQSLILAPREMNYKLQFTGPTGANAVEAAMKLARKVTGRSNIVAFTNGFHGCTLGAVAATGNQHHRGGAGVGLGNITRLPYEGYAEGVDSLALFETMLDDGSSGLDHPAAVLLEVIQGEGGLNCATKTWLQRLQKICRRHDILLIADDIQAGCGRSGHFFSFENTGFEPDIITLSKSLSGFGLPFALVLMKPELDCWKPGEHNGTFRGNNHAFVTATAALNHYWQDGAFQFEIQKKAKWLAQRLDSINASAGGIFTRKGRGMMQGLASRSGDLASKICAEAFQRGLIIETSGADGEVIKCLCSLTITQAELEEGLNILSQSVNAVLEQENRKVS